MNMQQSAIEAIPFHTSDFEGPLDLLLHLINKNKLNIYDIAIFSLVEQYLDYMNSLQESDLDIASEFVAMASRLVYIKSVMLLPRHEEEKEQLKKELEGELIEYSLCKQVSYILSDLYKGELLLSKPPTELNEDFTYHRKHTSSELLTAYLAAVGRKTISAKHAAKVFEPLVKRRIVSVGSRIIKILKNLYRKKTVDFGALFSSQYERDENVATFLALLELVKNKRIIITEDNFIKFGKADGEAIG